MNLINFLDICLFVLGKVHHRLNEGFKLLLGNGHLFQGPVLNEQLGKMLMNVRNLGKYEKMMFSLPQFGTSFFKPGFFMGYIICY